MKHASSILALMAHVLATCLGCERQTNPTAGLRVIVISGDTAGWIMPCGCAANQSGGLLRRGGHLRELRKTASVLYVDVGGASAGTSEYHKRKFEAIARGEVIMGVAAHNIGRSEIAFGASYLREASSATHLPLLSANVRDAQGSLVAAPLRIVEHGGVRVALVGVCSPEFAAGNVMIDDPLPAIRSTLAAHAGRYDAVLVLAYISDDGLRELASSLPEADAIIGGPTGQAMAPRVLGPTLVASATNKGKFLVELQLPPSVAKTWTGRVVEITADILDDPEQNRNLQAYLADLAKRNYPIADAGLVPVSNYPADYRVADTASCVECHKDEHGVWSASKHSRAWQTLQSKGFHVDSYCQQCHTTGAGLPGGFTSANRSDRVDVGCASCHGPSQAHVLNPKVRTPFAAYDTCTRCHDHENSPTFDPQTYWSKIRHGPTKASLNGGNGK